jgi:hypothetical protein
MEKEEILKQMGKKIVEAMDPEKAKEVLLGVVNGNDIYEEILGNRAAQETQMPKRRRARRKKNAVVETPPPEV